MKRNFIYILILLSVSLHSMAQNIGEVLYVYRNDGQFNAFFREEVQSIGYSQLGIDGTWNEGAVTQLITTADSVYQIPLAVIDSISFVQPETIINADVFPLTSEHSAYISNADTLQFTMSSTTPSELRPKVGNIVVGTADCEVFPDGIIAKVESIKNKRCGW